MLILDIEWLSPINSHERVSDFFTVYRHRAEPPGSDILSSRSMRQGKASAEELSPIDHAGRLGKPSKMEGSVPHPCGRIIQAVDNVFSSLRSDSLVG
jgi:hypothetical protein